MRAAGALPSEQRCLDMNDAQWLWFYMNLEKDKEEDRDIAENYLDYLGSWFNPELAKSVMKIKNQKKRKENMKKNNGSFGNNPNMDEDKPMYESYENEFGEEMVYADTAVNDGFEEELKRAMAAEGVEGELVELPDSSQAGDASESKEDFLSRVMEMQKMAGTDFGLPPEPENILETVDPLIAPLTDKVDPIPNTEDLDYFEDE